MDKCISYIIVTKDDLYRLEHSNVFDYITNLGVYETNKPKFFSENWLNRNPSHYIKRGNLDPYAVYGCFKSHIDLYEKYITLNLNKPLLILESDAVINEDLSPYVSELVENSFYGREYVYLGGTFWKEPKKISNLFSEVDGVNTTVGIIYKDVAAVKAVHSYLSDFEIQHPVDIQINNYNYSKDYLPLITNNSVIRQNKNFKSTISK